MFSKPAPSVSSHSSLSRQSAFRDHRQLVLEDRVDQDDKLDLEEGAVDEVDLFRLPKVRSPLRKTSTGHSGWADSV